MSEFELRRALRSLQRERSPGRDLWPGVARRIAAAPHAPADLPLPHPSQRWPWLLALAASVLLAVLVALPRMQPPAGPPSPATLVGQTGATGGGARALQLQADALTLEYVAALDEFGAARLPPALAPALTELDSSAAQIRAALRQDPNALFLLDQLRRTYSQRLRLTQLAVAGPGMAGPAMPG